MQSKDPYPRISPFAVRGSPQSIRGAVGILRLRHGFASRIRASALDDIPLRMTFRKTSLRYNQSMPDSKPFRLTESVKAAG
jgi:hypothetical protein